MSQNPNQFITPVGRLVQGDPFTPQEKDASGNPLTVKRGPNAGQPRKQWFVGLAISKTDPGWPALWAQLQMIARQSFPTLFDAAGKCLRPNFAWKVIDGDSTEPDERGNIPRDREGFAGCWVLRMAGGFPIEVYDQNVKPLHDPQAIKRGYYVRVMGTVNGNNDPLKPGLFLNPASLQLMAYGPEIQSGPDYAAVFKAAPVASLPAGAMAVPAASQHMPSAPATPAPATSGPGAPAAPSAQPYPQILKPSAGAPMPPAAPAPAPVDNWRIGPDGQAYSETQLRNAGWTDEQIRGLPLDPNTQF